MKNQELQEGLKAVDQQLDKLKTLKVRYQEQLMERGIIPVETVLTEADSVFALRQSIKQLVLKCPNDQELGKMLRKMVMNWEDVR